jgi:hypothetical protein
MVNPLKTKHEPELCGMVKAIYSWKPISRRPIGRPKTRWVDDVRKDIRS